jgi:uncharacterized membrane protein YozB (DUF420 family)
MQLIFIVFFVYALVKGIICIRHGEKKKALVWFLGAFVSCMLFAAIIIPSFVSMQ